MSVCFLGHIPLSIVVIGKHIAVIDVRAECVMHNSAELAYIHTRHHLMGPCQGAFTLTSFSLDIQI